MYTQIQSEPLGQGFRFYAYADDRETKGEWQFINKSTDGEQEPLEGDMPGFNGTGLQYPAGNELAHGANRIEIKRG